MCHGFILFAAVRDFIKLLFISFQSANVTVTLTLQTELLLPRNILAVTHKCMTYSFFEKGCSRACFRKFKMHVFQLQMPFALFNFFFFFTF